MNERPADSIVSAKERAARIRAENAQREREQAEAEKKKMDYAAKQKVEARKIEDEAIEKVGLISSDETRENLLDRIREMRQETPPAVAPAVPQRSEGMMKEFDAEQEAGRAAVAKTEAEMERGREARQKAEAEKKAREGDMVPVHHPNPSQDEQYPATGGTLGKRK